MPDYKIVEKFISINGEGIKAGELSVFIRLAGCNLDCSYCDTKWANKKNVLFENLSENEIYKYIKSTQIKNVTITGGEPLLNDDISELLDLLSTDKELNVEIETNGSIDISFLSKISNRPSFTLDYKLPGSRMEDFMKKSNFNLLSKNDSVKFVISDLGDLIKAKKIIDENFLIDKCSVFFSPVFGNINPDKIVEFMKNEKLNGVKLQLQLHKFIWDPSKRGV